VTQSEPTVLVTGGAGYIGSHTCRLLASRGYRPVTYDNLSNGHAHAVRWGPLVRGDILDRQALHQAFAEHRPRAVMHFAALAYVGESVKDPTTYYRNNFCGALAMLDTMRAFDCRAFVFSSTCAVYGHSEGASIGEDHPHAPVNPYGRSKAMVEQLLRDCDAAHELRSVSLRYFNAAGADPQGDLGEEHDPETHAIPLALQTAAGLRPQFDVYGTDYPTPDGTAIRDYVHVADLAEAHVAALGYLERGGETTALNLGTGQGHSVREVVAMVERVTGRRVAVREAPRRAGDPPALVAKAGRANSVLGWQASNSDLAFIVDSAWRWLQRASAAQ
jgi:UDP-glucose-4-epimerase GalE